jgi:hypothetical protein
MKKNSSPITSSGVTPMGATPKDMFDPRGVIPKEVIGPHDEIMKNKTNCNIKPLDFFFHRGY